MSSTTADDAASSSAGGEDDEDPLGPDYWARFDRRAAQAEADRTRRNALYGGCDPATWGWRAGRPAQESS